MTNGRKQMNGSPLRKREFAKQPLAASQNPANTFRQNGHSDLASKHLQHNILCHVRFNLRIGWLTTFLKHTMKVIRSKTHTLESTSPSHITLSIFFAYRACTLCQPKINRSTMRDRMCARVHFIGKYRWKPVT